MEGRIERTVPVREYYRQATMHELASKALAQGKPGGQEGSTWHSELQPNSLCCHVFGPQTMNNDEPPGKDA